MRGFKADAPGGIAVIERSFDTLTIAAIRDALKQTLPKAKVSVKSFETSGDISYRFNINVNAYTNPAEKNAALWGIGTVFTAFEELWAEGKI